MVDTTSLAYPPRPLEPITLAKEPSRAALAQKLVSSSHISADYAAIIARAVVDPTAVRNQIDHPTPKRFPGGVAWFLNGDVFTAAVCASPINPREFEQTVYPVAARAGEPNYTPLKGLPADGNQCALRLEANSPAHVKWILKRNADDLVQATELREGIMLDGVLEPVTLIPAQFVHGDGSPNVVALISADGSTRISICQDLTQFDPFEVAYFWPQAPLRDWRGKLGRLIGIQDMPARDVTDDQAAAHRALTCPARILISVEAVRGGEPINVVMAHRAIVGGIHVDPPRRWPEGSRMDEIADAVLDQLLSSGLINTDVRMYLSGLWEPSTSQAKGFGSYPDVRAARILKTVFDQKHHKSISAGFRGLVVKPRLNLDDKFGVAAELILRSFRSDVPSKEIDAYRSVLQRTINMAEWRERPWSITLRNPDEMLADALQELASDDDTLGPSQLELAIIAAYWLIAKRVLRRERSGKDKDQRTPSVVIRTMALSALGLRQLHRAVVDGRNDPRVEVLVRQVDEDGNVIEAAGGGYLSADDDYIRNTFSGDTEQPTTIAAPDQTEATPRYRLRQAFRKLDSLSLQLLQEANTMATIEENGAQLVMKEGVPSATAADVVERLVRVQGEVSVWSYVNKSRMVSTVLPELDSDEVFGTHEDRQR